MRTKTRFYPFASTVLALSLAASIAGNVLAEDAATINLKKTSPAVTSYDLEITDGLLVWNGLTRKDKASSVPPTLANVVDLLRDRHPEANFVVSPGLADKSVSDLKMRNGNLETTLEAVRIASGAQFIWQHAPTADGNHSLFVLSEIQARTDNRLQVEAFNVSGYLDSLNKSADFTSAAGTKENKAELQALIEEKMVAVERMVAETVDQYRAISASMNRTGSSSLHAPSIRFHRGANLVVIIGEPEAVAVAAKVIGALPYAQRSVASNYTYGDENRDRSDAYVRLQQLLSTGNSTRVVPVVPVAPATTSRGFSSDSLARP